MKLPIARCSQAECWRIMDIQNDSSTNNQREEVDKLIYREQPLAPTAPWPNCCGTLRLNSAPSSLPSKPLSSQQPYGYCEHIYYEVIQEMVTTNYHKSGGSYQLPVMTPRNFAGRRRRRGADSANTLSRVINPLRRSAAPARSTCRTVVGDEAGHLDGSTHRTLRGIFHLDYPASQAVATLRPLAARSTCLTVFGCRRPPPGRRHPAGVEPSRRRGVGGGPLAPDRLDHRLQVGRSTGRAFPADLNAAAPAERLALQAGRITTELHAPGLGGRERRLGPLGDQPVLLLGHGRQDVDR